MSRFYQKYSKKYNLINTIIEILKYYPGVPDFTKTVHENLNQICMHSNYITKPYYTIIAIEQ